MYKLGIHERIPQLLAYFEENQEFYLVQEYIYGHDLDEEIKPGEPISQEPSYFPFTRDTRNLGICPSAKGYSSRY